MISLNILSRQEMLQYYPKHPEQYYISILPTGGPDSEKIVDGPKTITLVFDDVLQDEQKSMYPIANMTFQAKAFTNEQAKQLVQFIKKIPKNSIVNIHCVHGRSRSIAVAKFILEQHSQGNTLVYQLLNDNR